MSRRMRQSPRLAVLALVAASTWGGCDGSQTPPPIPSAAPVAAAVPRPSEVVGTAVLVQPAALMKLAKEAYGLEAPLLERRLGVLVTDLAGLPVMAAEHVDEAGPLRLAAVGPTPRAEVVVAVPLRAADRLLLVATAGESAPFRSVRRGRVDYLEPVRAGGKSLAVATNHLIIGESAAAVAVAAEFLGDPASNAFDAAVGDGPRFAGELPLSVLARLKPSLGGLSSWLALAPLPPGLGDALGTAGPVAFSVTFGVAGIRCELGAKLASPLDAFETGPIDALLELPAYASLAMAAFVSKPARMADAKTAESALSGVVGGEAAGRLGTGLEKLADARGSRWALAFESGTRGPMIYGSLALSDPGAADAAVAEVVRALDRGDAPVPDGGAGISGKKTVIERLGDAYKVRVVTPGGAASTIALRLEGDRLWVAAAVDPDVALRKMLGDGALGLRLRDVPAALEASRALGASESSLVFFADPVRLMLERPLGDPAQARSAILIALRLEGPEVTLRGFADAAALGSLVRAASR